MVKRGLTYRDGVREYNFNGECNQVYQEALKNKLAAENAARFKAHEGAALDILGELCAAAKKFETRISRTTIEPAVVQILRDEGLGVEFDGLCFWVSFQPREKK